MIYFTLEKPHNSFLICVIISVIFFFHQFYTFTNERTHSHEQIEPDASLDDNNQFAPLFENS